MSDFFSGLQIETGRLDRVSTYAKARQAANKTLTNPIIPLQGEVKISVMMLLTLLTSADDGMLDAGIKEAGKGYFRSEIGQAIFHNFPTEVKELIMKRLFYS